MIYDSGKQKLLSDFKYPMFCSECECFDCMIMHQTKTAGYYCYFTDPPIQMSTKYDSDIHHLFPRPQTCPKLLVNPEFFDAGKDGDFDLRVGDIEVAGKVQRAITITLYRKGVVTAKADLTFKDLAKMNIKIVEDQVVKIGKSKYAIEVGAFQLKRGKKV